MSICIASPIIRGALAVEISSVFLCTGTDDSGNAVAVADVAVAVAVAVVVAVVDIVFDSEVVTVTGIGNSAIFMCNFLVLSKEPNSKVGYSIMVFPTGICVWVCERVC